MKKLILSAALLLTISGSPTLKADPASKVIASAVQRGSFVYIYNEKGSQIGTIPGGSGPKDGLVGYTGSTVSVRRGSFVYIYNANGSQISTVPAGN
jgi:hypothetical protein